MAGPTEFKVIGAILIFLAAITLGLGVVDIYFLLIRSYCSGLTACFDPNGAAYNPEIVILTLLASGIWGSILVLITGALAIGLFKNPVKMRKVFIVFCVIAATIGAPAMTVIMGLKALFIGETTASSSTLGYSPGGSDTTNLINFIIALVIFILGLFELLLCACLLTQVCACWKKLSPPSTEPKGVMPTGTTPAPTPAPAPGGQPAPAPNQPPTSQPMVPTPPPGRVIYQPYPVYVPRAIPVPAQYPPRPYPLSYMDPYSSSQPAAPSAGIYQVPPVVASYSALYGQRKW